MQIEDVGVRATFTEGEVLRIEEFARETNLAPIPSKVRNWIREQGVTLDGVKVNNPDYALTLSLEHNGLMASSGTRKAVVIVERDERADEALPEIEVALDDVGKVTTTTAFAVRCGLGDAAGYVFINDRKIEGDTFILGEDLFPFTFAIGNRKVRVTAENPEGWALFRFVVEYDEETDTESKEMVRVSQVMTKDEIVRLREFDEFVVSYMEKDDLYPEDFYIAPVNLPIGMP